MKYKIIKQKPYCCVPACLIMVLDRRKVSHASQDEIGYQLGLIVPDNESKIFSKVRIGEKTKAGYGTQLGNKKYSINKFFRNNKIKLKEKYYSIEVIDNIKKFIAENIKHKNDLLVCFNNKVLYGRGDYGHVSIIDDIKGNQVILIDPQKKQRKYVLITDLIKAIEYQGKDNRAGFWLINNK